MDLPNFDGTDPVAWITRVEQYFLVHATPEPSKVRLAVVAMEGSAMGWVRWALRKQPEIPWNQFCSDLVDRFGDDSAINAYEALHNTRQTGDIETYTSLFEARVVQLPEFPEAQYVGMFLSGLKKYIRDQIPDSAITDVHSAIRAARKIARNSRPPDHQPRMNASLSQPPRVPSHPRPGKGSAQPTSISSVGPPPSAPAVGVRSNQNPHRVSNEEFLKHRAAGTCFRCGGVFGPLHRCPLKSLHVIIGEEEEETELESPDSQEVSELEEPTGELQQLLLSELTSFGFDGSQTIKLMGRVEGQPVTVMIDSGASHCFISERVAMELGLPVDSKSRLAVLLGDGTRVQTGGVCAPIQLSMEGQIFPIVCYVFPLGGVDIILGCSWLATLGDVKANWSKLSMEFQVDGATVCLHGNPALTRGPCKRGEFAHLEPGDRCWVLWSLNGIQPLSHFSVSSSLSQEHTQELELLVSNFPKVLEAPKNLPPSRVYDHRIPLQPGARPVSVKPYRYNHA